MPIVYDVPNVDVKEGRKEFNGRKSQTVEKRWRKTEIIRVFASAVRDSRDVANEL